MSKQTKHVIKFKANGETPGTFKFKEVTEAGMPPKVDSLYVKRWVLGDTQPPTLTLTIEVP